MKRVYLLAGVVALLAAGESQACFFGKRCRPRPVACQTAPVVVPASYSQPVQQSVPVAAPACQGGNCPNPASVGQRVRRAF